MEELNNQLHALSPTETLRYRLSSQPAGDPAAPLWEHFLSLCSYPLVNATPLVGRTASMEP